MNQLCSETGCTKQAQAILHGPDLNEWPVCFDHFHKHTDADTTPKTIKVSTYDVELNRGMLLVSFQHLPKGYTFHNQVGAYRVEQSESDRYGIGDLILARDTSVVLVHCFGINDQYTYALRDTDVILRIPSVTV